MLAHSFQAEVAVIVPFVTRLGELILDRRMLDLAPASAAAKGVYRLLAAEGAPDGTVVLQGSGVTLAFVQDTIPRLLDDGIDLEVLYVVSPELFDLLPDEGQDSVFTDNIACHAMGITGFTLPTMYRQIRS